MLPLSMFIPWQNVRILENQKMKYLSHADKYLTLKYKHKYQVLHLWHWDSCQSAAMDTYPASSRRWVFGSRHKTEAIRFSSLPERY